MKRQFSLVCSLILCTQCFADSDGETGFSNKQTEENKFFKQGDEGLYAQSPAGYIPFVIEKTSL